MLAWKHTRISFSQCLNQRTKSPFEFVHSDIWGPSRAESTLGFRYFVTFIDDYSRCTWLFLMKLLLSSSLFSRSSMLKFELNLILPFVSYVVIMPRNIFLHQSPPLCPHMGFFTSPLVLTLLNRMEWLSARIVI